jgi:hypothetical protein
VTQVVGAVGRGDDRRIVRRDRERGPARRKRADGVDQRRRRGRVELAGRLVGDDEGGIADDRGREREPLLLAPGELVR